MKRSQAASAQKRSSWVLDLHQAGLGATSIGLGAGEQGGVLGLELLALSEQVLAVLVLGDADGFGLVALAHS